MSIKLTIGKRSIINTGAIVSVLVLEKGPTTAIMLDTFLSDVTQGWIKLWTEINFKTIGKLCAFEH